MGFKQLKELIFNLLCLKDIITIVEMIYHRFKSFDFVEKIKERKICSSYKDHTRTYTFDPNKMYLVDKREPNYTYNLLNMFNAYFYPSRIECSVLLTIVKYILSHSNLMLIIQAM